MTNVKLIQPELLNFKIVLEFWFNECKPKDWFVKDKKFDHLINEKFYNLVCKALESKLDDWTVTLDGSVALILLLDQFTLNMFRSSPQFFSGDKKSFEYHVKIPEKISNSRFRNKKETISTNAYDA